MNSRAHISVLADDVVRLLEPDFGGHYIDGTLGAGGHTRLLLEASNPDGRVLAIDRDESAIELSEGEIGDSLWSRVTPCHGSFGDVEAITRDNDWPPADGLLVDLGVSSMQLDRGERGFSFSHDGPLDMRMDRSQGETALELIRRSSERELMQILRDFGEERYAPRISPRLKEAARAQTAPTTSALANLISDAIPAKAKRHQRIHPATKTFQALRIAVNEELDELDRLLDAALAVLAPGGRCAIISFHSLEDRRVKHRFREWAWSSSLPPNLAEAAGERSEPLCKVITRKPVTATDDEIARNPRSRSAKLRVCEKAAAP